MGSYSYVHDSHPIQLNPQIMRDAHVEKEKWDTQLNNQISQIQPTDKWEHVTAITFLLW